NDVAHGTDDSAILELFPLLTSHQARRGLLVVELLIQQISGAIGGSMQRVAPGATEMVGQFVGGDGKKVSLKFTAIIEMGEAIEEADEGFLNDVFARGPIVEAPFDEGQKPSLITRDEVFPSSRVSLADLLDEQPVAFGCHRPCRSSTGTSPL